MNYREISSEVEGVCSRFSYVATSPFLGKRRPFQGCLAHSNAMTEHSGIKIREPKGRSLFSDIESSPEHAALT